MNSNNKKERRKITLIIIGSPKYRANKFNKYVSTFEIMTMIFAREKGKKK